MNYATFAEKRYDRDDHAAAGKRQVIYEEKRAAKAPKRIKRRTPPPVRKGAPGSKGLKQDLGRYYSSCMASAPGRYKGQRRKSYCAGVAWKRARVAGRHKTYFRSADHKESAMAGKRRHPKRGPGGRFVSKEATRKQIAAAKRNIKKAQAAKKAQGQKRRKSTMARKARRHPVKGYSYKRKGKRVRVPAHTSKESPRRRRRIRRRRTAREATPKQIAAAKRNIKKAQKARRKAKTARSECGGAGCRRKHQVRGYTYMRKGKSVSVPGHTSYEARRRPRRRSRRRSREEVYEARRRTRRSRRRARAMENPLSGGELVMGGITGVVGFVASDLADRWLATHAFAASAAQGGDVDSPAAGQVYNYQAVAAPMDVKRWGVGLGMAAFPIIIAGFVRNPMARSVLQFFGVGAGLRTLGRGATDLMVRLTGKRPLGMRAYADEISASNALKNAQATSVALPAAAPVALAGLARKTLGTCAACGKGFPCPCQLQHQLPPVAGVPEEATRVAAPVNVPTAPALPAARPNYPMPQRPAGVGITSWRSKRAA